MKKAAWILITLLLLITACTQKTIVIVTPQRTNARLDFGVERLQQSLEEADYQVEIRKGETELDHEGKVIAVGPISSDLLQDELTRNNLDIDSIPGKEGYIIRSTDHVTIIGGSDSSGTLYGCLEIRDSIQNSGHLPNSFSKNNQPEMVMRGTSIGLQKTSLLPGRGVYEYPINEKNFPWFYNKKLW